MPKLIFNDEHSIECFKKMYPTEDPKMIAKFFGCSPRYVRQLAYILGVEKDKSVKLRFQMPNLKLGLDQRKALARDLRKHLDTLKLGQTSFVMIESEKQYNTLRVYICRWNKENQAHKGFRIRLQHKPNTDYAALITEKI